MGWGKKNEPKNTRSNNEEKIQKLRNQAASARRTASQCEANARREALKGNRSEAEKWTVMQNNNMNGARSLEEESRRLRG